MAGPFLPLFLAVVAVRAEALQVGPVPEQRRISLVRRDVVNVFRRRTAEGAGRMLVDELGP